MPEQSNDYRVAVFGAGGVGKSSIVQRFVKGTFSENYVPTVEDTYRQVISCNKQQNVCTLQITDTTGSHQFPAMQRLSISKGHAFIIVYSVDKEDTFAHTDSIFQEIQAVKGTNTDESPIILVGNKVDEPSAARRIATAIGQAKAERWGVSFIETSAKNNINIRELFEQLLASEKRRHLTLTPEKDSERKRKSASKKTKGASPKPNSRTVDSGDLNLDAPDQDPESRKAKCNLM